MGQFEQSRHPSKYRRRPSREPREADFTIALHPSTSSFTAVPAASRSKEKPLACSETQAARGPTAGGRERPRGANAPCVRVAPASAHTCALVFRPRAERVHWTTFRSFVGSQRKNI